MTKFNDISKTVDKLKQINWNIVIIGLLIIGLGISIITRPEPSNTVKEYTLQAKNDSLKQVIKLNDEKLEDNQNMIVLLSDSVKVITKQKNKNDVKLSKLQKEYKKVLTRTALYDSNDVTQYFSNRYK
tara:strand:- start:857 stop:1240 length:384 start_codon:yes stop_codon:yes gene_type:complete